MTIKIGSYNFDGPFGSTKSLRNESGVYAILGSNGPDELVVLDVGESSTLRDRVARHDRQSQWRQCGYRVLFVAVHYTKRSDPDAHGARASQYLQAALRRPLTTHGAGGRTARS